MNPISEHTEKECSAHNEALTFHLQTKATAPASRAVVHACIRIISENIADQELLYFFQLALFEACSNVVLHAYPPEEPGDLAVYLRVLPGELLEAVVRDWGRGFATQQVTIAVPPPEAVSGRGLYIISKSADQYDIQHKTPGVSVKIIKNMRKDQWIPYE